MMPDRITLVISSMAAGGAERVMSILANQWASHGKSISLITLTGSGQAPFYKLDRGIDYLPLGIAGDSSNAIAGLVNNISRIKTLRKAIRDTRPDIVISFMTQTNVLTFLATRGSKTPVVLSEHIEPTMESPGKIWEILRRITYPFAEGVTLLTERARGYYPKSVQKIATVIPNPVFWPDKKISGEVQIQSPAIVAMGRMDQQKGFDLLLKAFAKAGDRCPSLSLYILGDGILRPSLEALRDSLALKGRVFMPGRVATPNDYLLKADMFVLSSRYEGFPMALCEAMACGLPVISFDCKTGPEEIIRNQVDGILVPPEDVDALSDAIASLMNDESKRKRMATAAPEVVERFGVEKIMEMWAHLAESIVK